MLSQQELTNLYEVISDKEKTFEEIAKLFTKKFNATSQIKVSKPIIVLLEDNLLNVYQRIICYYLLYIMNKDKDMETNPFLSIILTRLKVSNIKVEQNFLIDFLCNQINYLNLTISQYIDEHSKTPKINTTQIIMQWEKYYNEFLKKKNINTDKTNKMRPIIYERNNLDDKSLERDPYINIFGNISLNESELNLNYIEGNYMSPLPINNSYIPKEPIWIPCYLNHNFIWEQK